MRLTSRSLGSPFLAVLFASAPALPDEVFLRGGGRVSGVIVERTPRVVVIETGPGRVTLPMSRVERIAEGHSALEAFKERAEALAASDVDGWAALARWAAERDLLTQSRIAWQRVLAADPRHPEANAGLGRVALGGVYMSADEAYRARGYVSFEGRWLTPAEHEAAVRERTAEQASRLEAREADLRLREAEARVREAEARADDAARQPMETGIPLGYGYGYSGYGNGYGYNSYGNGYGRRGAITSPLLPSRPLGPSHRAGPSYPAGGGRPRARHQQPVPPQVPATRPEAPQPAGPANAAGDAPARGHRPTATPEALTWTFMRCA